MSKPSANSPATPRVSRIPAGPSNAAAKTANTTPRPSRTHAGARPTPDDATPRASGLRDAPAQASRSGPTRATRSSAQRMVSRSPDQMTAALVKIRAKIPVLPDDGRAPAFNLRPRTAYPIRPSMIDRPPKPSDPKFGLIDFLCIPPPRIPDIYAIGKLTSTRDIPKDKVLDVVMEEDQRLLYVVPVPKMMTPLVDRVQKDYRHVVLDPKDWKQRDWILTVHPAVTSSHLPSIIRSESDTEDWVMNVLWRPALAAWFSVQDAATKKRMGKFPNFTSCHGGGSGDILPDGMLWELEDLLRATIEIKTHAAFVDTNQAPGTATFKHLMRDIPQLPPGYGVRFVWDEVSGATGTNKADKMIAQVWLQMVKHKMEVAALTNYNSVIFFVRRNQTLFMSGEYTRNENISLVIFAFLAYAMGSIPKDVLELPEEKGDWWRHFHGAGTSEAPGLDPTTLPERLWQHLHPNASN